MAKVTTVRPEDWDRYNWEAVEEIRGKRRMQKILRYIPQQGIHLDVGCGRGDGTALVSEYKKTVGLDYGRRSLRIAARKNTNLVQADGCVLPFSDSSFTSATLLDVLEHIPDGQTAVQEIYRVLRPEGVLVLQTPSDEAQKIKGLGIRLYLLLRKFENLLRRITLMVKVDQRPNVTISIKQPFVQQPYERPLAQKEIKRIVETAGFHIEQKGYIHYWHAIWVIKPFTIADLFILSKGG